MKKNNILYYNSDLINLIQKSMPRIVGVFGKSGFGKSFFIKNYIVPNYKNIICFDTQNEYNSEYGFTPVNSINDLSMLLGYYRKTHKKDFKIALKFQENFEDYLLALDMLYNAENYTLMIDEINIFGSNLKIHHTISKVVNIGRHSNVNLIVAARRLFQTNIIIRSQTNLFVFFKMTENSDLKYIQGISNKQFANDVLNLEKYQSKYLEC